MLCRERNIPEIESMYDVSFPKLSERYFKQASWPQVDAISDLVDQDHVFCLLYKVCAVALMNDRANAGCGSLQRAVAKASSQQDLCGLVAPKQLICLTDSGRVHCSFSSAVGQCVLWLLQLQY